MGKASRLKWEKRKSWPLERLMRLRGMKFFRDRIAAAKQDGRTVLYSTVSDPRKW